MKTEWDYSALADAYIKRPDYSDAAVDAMLSIAGVKNGALVCDVGAGVAHLSLMLAARQLVVTAIEPNEAMRANGIRRTENMSSISWSDGTGESTGASPATYDLVTFGSSFNVCDRGAALKETARILRPDGWFACMWNHRDLDDPVQAKIEAIISDYVPEYGYGTRREDQAAVIEQSRLFGPVIHADSRIIHQQKIDECVEAWRSHATLARQAGQKFEQVVDSIGDYLSGLGKEVIEIPYSTNIWIAQSA